MGFTKSTENLIVHQNLAEYPVEDGQFTVENLRKELDRPALVVQRDLNKVVDELGEETSASSLGAKKLDVNDNSGTNIQEKIYELNRRMQNLVLGEIPDGSITENKLNETFRNYLAKKNGELQKNLNAEMLGGRTKESLENVGEMKITSQPLELDNYLLCDGSSISKEDYPEIDKILSFQPVNTTLVEKTNESLRTIIRAIYAKGITIVSAGDYGEYLFYKRDTDSNWAKSSLTSITSICFDGTYFYATSGSNKVYKSIDGITWETITTTSVSNEWATIDYIDGHFYLTNDYGSSSTGGIMYRTTDLTAIDSTKQVKEGSSYRRYRKVEKVNNKYFAYGDYRGQGGVISISDDGINWTDIYSGSGITWTNLLFDGEYYIFVGTYMAESPYMLKFWKCHKDNDIYIKENWVEITVEGTTMNNSNNPYKGILYKDFIIVVGPDGKVFTLDKNFNIVKIIDYGCYSHSSNESLCFVEKNGDVYFYCTYDKTSGRFTEIRIDNGYALPELTNNIKEGYHYLKVGE